MIPSILASWTQNSNTFIADRSYIGGKAEGLFLLPKAWVPDFIVLTKTFYEAWKIKQDTDSLFKELSQDERNILIEFLRRNSKLGEPSKPVIVRSNSPEEYSVESRGSYQSQVVKPVIQDIAIAIDKILADSYPNPIYIIVQHYIQPAWPGHMSNERRVSSKPSSWLVEASPALPYLPKEGLIRGKKLADREDLLAKDHPKVLGALRTAAGALKQIGKGYFHCEWVWDGNRVWIVQADKANPIKGDLYANRYIESKEALPEKFSHTISDLHHFHDIEGGKWKKLERPILFRRLGWPTADIYVLTGTAWNKSVKAGHSRLLPDLVALCKYPVVIRCDIATHLDRDDLLLPTSEPTTNTARIMNFMTKTSNLFEQENVSDTDWAFLLATKVPARASAMIHAHPYGQVIRVDASWGFPDGLLFFPHDTYFYYPAKRQIEVKLRYKGLCLLAQEDDWAFCDVGPPHDWMQVLSSEEIGTLAQWGLELAKARKTDIQLMCLARIGGIRGKQSCLPWHFTTLDIPRYRESRTSLVNLKTVKLITSRDDLHALSSRPPDQTIKGYLIRPNKSLLRDSDFIRAVAGLAAQHKVPLLFEGSLLGHAYYLMVREGAAVIPITPENPEYGLMKYDKLVRDNIPAVIERAGGIARIQTIPRDEAVVLLARKLIEEAYEVWNADGEAIADELADVLEVVDSLRQQIGIEAERLNEIQENKRISRGGFSQLVFLKETLPKTFESVDFPKGILPLFLDNVIYTSTRSIKESQNQYLSILQLDDPRVIIQFSLPILPPVEKGRRQQIIKNALDEMEVICEYGKENLTFTVRRSKKGETLGAKQLTLFPEVNNAD